MENEIIWYTGQNDFLKNTLSISETKKFTVEIIENTEFDTTRNIHDILNDHLKNKQTSIVEILYSGGLDSEFVLSSCLRNKIPIKIMTLVIKVKGAIINTSDLYYSEKFCRENNLKQNLIYFDAVDFYESGKYLDYLLPYNITEPHVASHFWLIDHCDYFPIIGGDWPWIHTHLKNKILSPYKLDFCCYERYMHSKGITGIGNMLSNSFESCYYFMKEHIMHYEQGYDTFHTVPFMKYKMYGLSEPRLKSYGWESCHKTIFNIIKYKAELLSRIGKIQHNIKWEKQIGKLINSVVYENDKFW